MSCCCKLICVTKKTVKENKKTKVEHRDTKTIKKRVLSDSYIGTEAIDEDFEKEEYKNPPKKRRTVRFTDVEGPWTIDTIGSVATLVKKFNGETFTYNPTDMTIRDINGVKNEVITRPDFRKTLELRLRSEFSGARRKLSTEQESKV